MKPVSLRLRGFRGIRAGMGLEEVFIDFASLPEGLIAVSGTNGAGKTTLLDNLHPFRLMPYKLRKAKDWSPSAFSYYEECYGPDAEKEFIFEMVGKMYRALILIDADRRKQEAYLYVKDCDSWVPLNDGKTKTYDAAVELLVGSPSLFFTSVFRGQGAKNLSDYTRGDIMSLIAELLNIDHIKEQGDKSRKVIDALKESASADQTRLSVLKDELATEKGIMDELKGIGDQLKIKNRELDSTQKALDENSRAIAEVERKKVLRESELVRLEDLITVQNRDVADMEEISGKLLEMAARVTQEKGRVAGEFKEMEADITSETRSLEKEQTAKEATWKVVKEKLAAQIERADKISKSGPEIRKKVSEEEKAKADLVRLKDNLASQEAEREIVAGKERELAEVKAAITRTEADMRVLKSKQDSNIKQITSAIEQAEKEAGKLNGLDCNPRQAGWINESCRFINDAVIAKGRIPELKAEMARVQEPNTDQIALANSLENLRKETEILTPEVALIAKCNEDISKSRLDISSKEKEIEGIRGWTVLLPELEQAERNLVQWNSEMEEKGKEFDAFYSEVSEKLQALALKLSVKITEKAARLSDLAKEFEDETKALEAKRAAILERVNERLPEIDRLNISTNVDLAAELSSFRDQASGIKESITGIEEVIKSLGIRVGVLEGKLEELEGKRAEAEKLELRIDRFNKEIAKFSLLAKGCSNDGIIALEIDDAGPNISSLTNDLLTSCYGPRFTVRLETQSQKNNGEMKEDFDITVLDAETDESKSITDMSGGQVTWIEDAITRAVCLFNIHRSDRSFGTLFTDEKDGALDNERKTEFMAVKRRAMELGTHRREFFITQTPELREMADARIYLSKHGITIN